MKKMIKRLMYCILMGAFMHFLWGCDTEKETYFATDEPVQTIELPIAFPAGLTYQESPDSTVLIGINKKSAGVSGISGFEAVSGKRLWDLAFDAILVGQTEKNIVIYSKEDSTVYFIGPVTGKISRKISPQPDPLTSPSSLFLGMAFTDELYITTKPLYKQVISNGKMDTTWNIGITAKTWETNEEKWFIPPVKQIVIIEYPPVIKDDKMLIINPQQSISHGHSFQIISVKTGLELHRALSEGIYYYLGKNRFFELTESFVRKIDSFTQKEIWRIDGYFKMAQMWGTGKQVSILSRHADGSQNVLHILDAVSGNVLTKTDLPFFKDAAIQGAYLTRDKQLLLHFKTPNEEEPGTSLYDYWVHYDAKGRKALWRTDFRSESLSSLIPFVNL